MRDQILRVSHLLRLWCLLRDDDKRDCSSSCNALPCAPISPGIRLEYDACLSILPHDPHGFLQLHISLLTFHLLECIFLYVFGRAAVMNILWIPFREALVCERQNSHSYSEPLVHSLMSTQRRQQTRLSFGLWCLAVSAHISRHQNCACCHSTHSSA